MRSWLAFRMGTACEGLVMSAVALSNSSLATQKADLAGAEFVAVRAFAKPLEPTVTARGAGAAVAALVTPIAMAQRVRPANVPSPCFITVAPWLVLACSAAVASCIKNRKWESPESRQPLGGSRSTTRLTFWSGQSTSRGMPKRTVIIPGGEASYGEDG